MKRTKAEIHFHSCGPTGNVYWIMGQVRDQMRRESRHTDWNNAWERIQNTDYARAIEIMRELVDLIDDDGRY